MNLQQMANKVASKPGYQDFMTMPLMSSLMKQNPARQQTKTGTSLFDAINAPSTSKKQREKQEADPRKDTDRTTISSGKSQNLRVNDSESDVLSKMFDFMQRQSDWDREKQKSDKKYRKQLDKQKDRFLDETIQAITGKKTSKMTKMARAARKSGFLKYGIMAAAGIGGLLITKDALAGINWKEKFDDTLKDFKFPDFDLNSLTGGAVANFAGGSAGTPRNLDKTTFNQLSKEEQTAFLKTQQISEGSNKPGTLPYDLNNPGAMLYAPWQKQFGGELDTTGRGEGELKGKFAKFPTMEKGKEAQEALWKKTYGDMDLGDALRKYVAPQNNSQEKEFSNYKQNVYGAIEKVSPTSNRESSSLQEITKPTSGFGKRFLFGRSEHHGVDLPGKLGDPVVTTQSGTVIEVGDSGNKGYGKYVKIEHENGYKTLYAHLSSQDVKKGDKVSQGQLIGKVGSTGDSTGPHLHYEVFNQNGQKIDPQQSGIFNLNPVSADYKLSSADDMHRETLGIKKDMSKGSNVALIDTTNVIGGSTTYLVKSEYKPSGSALIEKQFNYA